MIHITHTRHKGRLGESVACRYLSKRGFRVILQNYQKKWGEIDIIAEKSEQIHFFEVKSVTGDISRVTDCHRPEDNVHGLKLRHIGRMIETFMAERGLLGEPFQFHVLTVYLDMHNRRAQVFWFKNVIV